MTTRVMPPGTVGGARVTNQVNSSAYSASPGQVLDIPDGDAQALAAVGWYILARVGPTAQRAAGVTPTASTYFDTAMNQLNYWDGVNWRSIAGVAR